MKIEFELPSKNGVRKKSYIRFTNGISVTDFKIDKKGCDGQLLP